jgi:hypothetical protein
VVFDSLPALHSEAESGALDRVLHVMTRAFPPKRLPLIRAHQASHYLVVHLYRCRSVLVLRNRKSQIKEDESAVSKGPVPCRPSSRRDNEEPRSGTVNPWPLCGGLSVQLKTTQCANVVDPSHEAVRWRGSLSLLKSHPFVAREELSHFEVCQQSKMLCNLCTSISFVSLGELGLGFRPEIGQETRTKYSTWIFCLHHDSAPALALSSQLGCHPSLAVIPAWLPSLHHDLFQTPEFASLWVKRRQIVVGVGCSQNQDHSQSNLSRISASHI